MLMLKHWNHLVARFTSAYYAAPTVWQLQDHDMTSSGLQMPLHPVKVKAIDCIEPPSNVIDWMRPA